jgi:hypothetical protein
MTPVDFSLVIGYYILHIYAMLKVLVLDEYILGGKELINKYTSMLIIDSYVLGMTISISLISWLGYFSLLVLIGVILVFLVYYLLGH